MFIFHGSMTIPMDVTTEVEVIRRLADAVAADVRQQLINLIRYDNLGTNDKLELNYSVTITQEQVRQVVDEINEERR